LSTMRLSLVATACLSLIGSWVLLYRLTPSPWQIGGVAFPTYLAYIGFVFGIVVGVLAVPHSARIRTALAAAFVLVLFVAFWPSWDVSVSPYTLDPVALPETFPGLATGRTSLVLYTMAGRYDVASTDDVQQVPADAKVIGFKAFGFGVKERLTAVLRGWLVRPAIPLRR